MKTLPRPLLLAIIAIIVLTAGSLFLIRSCLFGKGGKGWGGAPAGMREEYATVPALFLEHNGKTVVLSIEAHLKIHSWTKRGNSVTKRASTTYYLQANDASTAALIREVKLKSHTDIKHYPVQVLGVSGKIAWIFAGEPMAFDGFTLEQLADISVLEEKNSLLKGKFPAERRYYRFDSFQQQLYFTAIDGSKWKLDPQSFKASPVPEEEEGDPYEKALAEVEAAEKQYRADYDSLQLRKNRRPSEAYSKGQISQAEYQRINKEYYAERDLLSARRDSLSDRKKQIWDAQRQARERENNLEDLAEGSPNYTDIKVNQDTVGGQWFGLYSKPEWNKLQNRFQFHSEYDETSRRSLYISGPAENKRSGYTFDKEAATNPQPEHAFLHGGFLLNRSTAAPIHLSNGDFLVIHRDQIGRDANWLLSRLSPAGKTVWTVNTALKSWADFYYTGKELLLMGNDNPDLSSGQINILLSISLQNGKGSRYDYYTNQLLNPPPQ